MNIREDMLPLQNYENGAICDAFKKSISGLEELQKLLVCDLLDSDPGLFIKMPDTDLDLFYPDLNFIDMVGAEGTNRSLRNLLDLCELAKKYYTILLNINQLVDNTLSVLQFKSALIHIDAAIESLKLYIE